MGRLFVVNLEGKIYTCKYCKTHLALCEDISFHCRYGKAYLFSKVVNVIVGTKEESMMTTGLHTVVDIFCVSCGSIVGWKYETAHEKSQKYKEGSQWIITFLNTCFLRFLCGGRFKVNGPDGSSYWASHEARIGGSDADDA